MEQYPLINQNKKSNHTKIIIGTLILLFIFIICLVWVLSSKSEIAETTDKQIIYSTKGLDFIPIDATNTDVYTTTAPKNTLSVSKKTQLVKPIRIYTLKETKNGFEPDTLVIERGDRVQIEFTAVDGAYDLVVAPPLNAYISANKGESTAFGFDTEDVQKGIYSFACQKLCPATSAQGLLIIR